MINKTAIKNLNKASSSIPVRIKPNGTVALPKDWIKNVLGMRVLITKINDIFVITPQKVRTDYSIDEINWKKIRPIAQKIRKQLFKEKYPALYATGKKKKIT